MKLLLFALLLCPTQNHLLAEYYDRALPTIDRFLQQLDREQDFAIFTLFNNIAIIISANADLQQAEPVTHLLRIAEEMQDKNPESRTFGNFRWYWSSPGVTDHNAAEFALARMLSIQLDTPNALADEDQQILLRMLERSIPVCMNRRIRPDYTNIALYNSIHLILLGQVFERPDVLQKGKHRLKNIAAHIWNHGIFEYNSPAYYHINIDSLQLGLRHVDDPETKALIHALLELFWTDMSLHWFKPGLRLGGAQSRTYNYLVGINVHKFRLLAFAGLCPYDHDARYHAVLNSFRADRAERAGRGTAWPSPEIVALNDRYPRWVTRNWGRDQGQWAAMYMLEDIALGTAGAKYDAQQNMVLTVDIADCGEVDVHKDAIVRVRDEFVVSRSDDHASDDHDSVIRQFQPRSYFIADGREDPYGTKLFSTGSGGQRKALHLDALWFGTQRTVDSLGLVLYPPEILNDPQVVNVQSHFVVRRPKEIWLDGEQIVLLPNEPVKVGNRPIVFRYATCAFGVRVVWSRDLQGQPAEVFLVDDGNEHGVYRLTVEHMPAASPGDARAMRERYASQGDTANAGAALWVRIDSDARGDVYGTRGASQGVIHVDSPAHAAGSANDIAIAVAGRDGILSISLRDGIVQTEPAAPLGILTLDGKDLGRPILERLPAAANFVQRRDTAVPIAVKPEGASWDAELGYSFFDDIVSDGAVRINQGVSWQLLVEQSGVYELWGRVQTVDAEHDSFWVEFAERLPDGSFMRRSFQADWHLGVRTDWTWVRLPESIFLSEGIWQLTLKPREYDGRIDRLRLLPESVIRADLP
ncbi:MAG: hypothetical protein FWG73_06685 [Planctomycetaceae bacterium]|nr:hypothetical protein [Planctomycetaceae bacterium]